jgi:dienelactone hydrolase
LVAGCGSGDSPARVAELAEYDETKPLRVRIEGENPGSTDLAYQSPRGGDVSATIVVPPDKPEGAEVPAVVYSHPWFANRALYFRESFDLADRGIAVLLVDATFAREEFPRLDLMDPVYSADAFRSLVRQDVVDLRRALDYLEQRKDIDMDRVAVVGQEYGALPAGGLAAVDDRISALVLSVVPAEPGRYWAKEFVPQETHESFAETIGDFDPIRLLDSIDADILIQLPRQDEDWPVKEYERLADEADDADVRWYEYGHAMGPEADADRQRWLVEALEAR